MYYYIYKITNLLNDNFYIGQHGTEDLDDDYFGSGVNITLAVKKYRKEKLQERNIGICSI